MVSGEIRCNPIAGFIDVSAVNPLSYADPNLGKPSLIGTILVPSR
jgi:hypothetical protein